MSARKLWDAGYHDLVSVLPPDAELSPNSRIDPKMRGKVPGKRGVNGLWYGYNFISRDERAEEKDVDIWEEWEANVGLLAEYYPGLDVDCEDETLSRAVSSIAEDILGGGPVRTSRPPRRLRVYRTQTPFGRMALEIEYKKKKHLVEMLCRGRQYLVHGTHPSGTEYGWEGAALWEYEPVDLALVSEDRVRGFFQELQRRLEEKGVPCTFVEEGLKEAQEAPPQEDLYAPDLETLTDVVRSIPNTGVDFPSRDDYITFGHAVKAAGAQWPAEAFELFLEWALEWEGDASNPTGNDPDVVEKDWERMRAPYRVGWQYLLSLSPDSAVFEFTADPNMTDDDHSNGGTIPTEYIDLSDLWAVEKILANGFAEKVRYAPEASRWHRWNDYAWSEDKLDRHKHEVALECVRLSVWCQERANLLPSKKAKAAKAKLENKATWFQSDTGITKVTNLLECHPAITVLVDDFDQDLWAINTPGGIVDLRTGTVGPSDPTRMFSFSTRYAPARGDAPLWFAFLDYATAGDKKLQRFLQRLAGYCLTGVIDESTLTFVHGTAATGKTTFIETLAWVLGDYAAEAGIEQFTASRYDRHPTEWARLVGKRLVSTEETQHGRKWDEQKLKKITGGGRLPARFMRENFFEYVPQFKLLVVGNAQPELDNVEEAMRRRLHIVPFNHVVPKVEQDLELKVKLREEGPQIMQWMVDGCLMWKREKLSPPEAVLSRTEEYFESEDVVQQWFNECCSLDEEAEIETVALFQVWRQWAMERGYPVHNHKWFMNAFAPLRVQHGMMKTRPSIDGRRPNCIKGVAIHADWERGI